MFKESIGPDEIQMLEYASFPGKIYVIDSVGAEFNRAIAYLRSQKIIGFDTETRHMLLYGFVWLINACPSRRIWHNICSDAATARNIKPPEGVFCI